MRRVLLIAAAVLACFVLAVEFIPIYMVIWDGGYDLTVHVKSPSGRPRSIYCEAYGQRKYADEACARLATDASAWRTVADPFDGNPLPVWVAVSGRRTLFGRYVHRMQFRFLAITAVMPDGNRVSKVIDLPDDRVSREVTLTLP
jgi:hypothetical protein